LREAEHGGGLCNPANFSGYQHRQVILVSTFTGLGRSVGLHVAYWGVKRKTFARV
jgi:hypothetical protein